MKPSSKKTKRSGFQIMTESFSNMATTRLAKRQQFTGSNYTTVIQLEIRQFVHISGFKIGDTQAGLCGRHVGYTNCYSQIPFISWLSCYSQFTVSSYSKRVQSRTDSQFQQLLHHTLFDYNSAFSHKNHCLLLPETSLYYMQITWVRTGLESAAAITIYQIVVKRKFYKKK